MIHLDDRSSVGMIYHAAAGVAATTGEMYLRENTFEKSGHDKMKFYLFLNKIMYFFSKNPKS